MLCMTTLNWNKYSSIQFVDVTDSHSLCAELAEAVDTAGHDIVDCRVSEV